MVGRPHGARCRDDGGAGTARGSSPPAWSGPWLVLDPRHLRPPPYALRTPALTPGDLVRSSPGPPPLVGPSWYEGFCLPALEPCLRHRCRLRPPAHREFLGDRPTWSPPANPAALADAPPAPRDPATSGAAPPYDRAPFHLGELRPAPCPPTAWLWVPPVTATPPYGSLRRRRGSGGRAGVPGSGGGRAALRPVRRVGATAALATPAV